MKSRNYSSNEVILCFLQMDNTAILEQKKALRSLMFSNRKNFDTSLKLRYDEWICEELEQLILSKKANVIHAYIPMLTEIDIQPLLNKLLQANKIVVCPKTLPKRMLENRVLSSLNDLEVGIMSTKHPREAKVYEGQFDLIIVPGMAFDTYNKRLGYGGGYYDNFLIKHPKALKVGIFYPFQKVEKVPVEKHDVSLDIILYKNVKA